MNMCDDVQPHEFSMTQVQDDDEEDGEEYYDNKTKTLAGFGNDSDIVSMTQVQPDESSSDDDDDEENAQIFAKPCTKVMPRMNNLIEHVNKQNEGVKNAPSPGSSDMLVPSSSATTQNANQNDSVVTKSVEDHLLPEKSKDDEDLSLFLSQTQNGATHISDAGAEVLRSTKVGESASNHSELSLSLHLSPEEASVKNRLRDAEHNDLSSTTADIGAKSVKGGKTVDSHDINSKKKHAVSQISQLEIDYESECQIANMAEIAVREEVIPGQNDQMLPISQTQDICNNSTLKPMGDMQNSKEEYDWNAFKDLIAYVFQKIAFGKLKRSIKVPQSSAIHKNHTAHDSSTGILPTQESTQEHACSAPSQQLTNNPLSRRHTGLVGISHNDVDSQGMISLSYESSAYEESQSQAKLSVALNENKTTVPIILPKQIDTNVKALDTNQEQSYVESSLPPAHAAKHRKHDFEQVVEETPQSLRESQNVVAESSDMQLDCDGRVDALGAKKERHNSGKWISTTKISKSKAHNVSSQDTEKIPLGRHIMIDSLEPEDDEDDEISKIVRGSISDGELEDEELPSETAVLDVSDDEIEGNSARNGDANLGKKRSVDDEKAILKIISHLFPEAREKDLGIKSFYMKVKTEYGKHLDDDIWIPFVWDSIFEMMNGLNKQVNSQCNREQFESSNFSDHDDNIPLSQVGICGEMSQDVAAQDAASKVALLVDAAPKPQLEVHEEWSLAAHRHRRRKESAEKDTNSDENKNKEDSTKPILKRKRDDCDEVTSKNPRVLADMIYKEDLADDFLVTDKKWRDLFHILKQRGWKWKYGSGIVEKKYLAPGATGKTGIIGTNIFLSPRSVVEFIRNTEPLPAKVKNTGNNAKENCDSIVQATALNTCSQKGAEDEELFSLLKQASLQINENASEPKCWGAIYSILKARGWEYKKAPKSISLKCAWIFIEPQSGESEPIMHEGEVEAIKSLCRRFGIELQLPTLETSRRRKRKSPQTTTEDSKFENDLAKAIERSKKKPKVGLKDSMHFQNANESPCDKKKEKIEEAEVLKGSGSVCKAGALLAEEKRDLYKVAAEHDDISTDPPGWKEIFAALQDEGWYYKNSSSGLRAWDYVCPSEGDQKPVVYANPRAVARALCHKFGIMYNAPSESQENIRSRRSRRPPKRFASPSPKAKRVEPKPKLPKNDVAAKEDKDVNEQLASSPSNFVPNSKTHNKNSKKAKMRKKMFSGYHFMFSGLSIHTRKALKRVIKDHGGFIYSEIAKFEKDMKECEKTPNEGEVPGMAAFVVLSLCEPSAYRKAKYLYSLAVGVPVVHFSWIYECLSKKLQISISKYVLPNGLSLIRGMYMFPSVPKEIDRDYDSCASNRMSKQEEVTQACLISPKPSQVVNAGIFSKMTVGLHIDSAKRRKDYLHTDWWYILNIAGALVYEGDIEYLKNAQVDVFICRMDDFSVLPELRKIANRKQVPIVTFEWCIQSLVNNQRLSFDAMPTFVAGKGAGSGHKGSSGSNIRSPSWASAMLTNIGHPEHKYFSAVRVNGVRYCIGDLVYMRKPWITINCSVNEDENSNLESDDCKYNYRLGIIHSFWETKKDGTKKVKWQSLDRVNAGNGNTVVATGEYVESPVDTMSKKFMLFDASECLQADNGNSLLSTALPSPSSGNSDVQFSRGNGCPPMATRLYFQIEDEEEEDYFEIVAEGKYDVYLMQQQRTN